MVVTNSSTNKKHKFYYSTVQVISRAGVYCATKAGSMYAPFVDMEAPVKIQLKNGLLNIFNVQGHTIYVSDQVVFTLKYSGLHNEEGNKINRSDPLTATQRRSGCFYRSQ